MSIFRKNKNLVPTETQQFPTETQQAAIEKQRLLFADIREKQKADYLALPRLDEPFLCEKCGQDESKPWKLIWHKDYDLRERITCTCPRCEYRYYRRPLDAKEA